MQQRLIQRYRESLANSQRQAMAQVGGTGQGMSPAQQQLLAQQSQMFQQARAQAQVQQAQQRQLSGQQRQNGFEQGTPQGDGNGGQRSSPPDSNSRKRMRRNSGSAGPSPFHGQPTSAQQGMDLASADSLGRQGQKAGQGFPPSTPSVAHTEVSPANAASVSASPRNATHMQRAVSKGGAMLPPQSPAPGASGRATPKPSKKTTLKDEPKEAAPTPKSVGPSPKNTLPPNGPSSGAGPGAGGAGGQGGAGEQPGQGQGSGQGQGQTPSPDLQQSGGDGSGSGGSGPPGSGTAPNSVPSLSLSADSNTLSFPPTDIQTDPGAFEGLGGSGEEANFDFSSLVMGENFDFANFFDFGDEGGDTEVGTVP